MQTLQTMIEGVLNELPEQVLAQILEPKLKSLGFTLSKKDQRKLIAHILEGRATP